ncbi:MAG: integrase, partial [Campylobacter sp.]
SKKSNSKNTGYYQRVAKALDIYFKHKQITQISYQDCEDFQLHLLNNKRLNKKTINNYTCYASRMFDYAIKIGLISQNPFKLLSSFKISKDQKSPKDNFSMDELVKIFKTDKKELKDYMAFALHTGLRLSEIWSLDESSVSERDGIKFIKVQTAKQKGGDVKFRELPIHKNIYRLSDMKWLTKIKRGKSDCNYFGKRLNKHIHAVLPDSNVSFHRLRANFASAIKNYSLENGFTDVTSVLLGHATDLATDVYAKDISLKAKLKAMNGLNIFSNL